MHAISASLGPVFLLILLGVLLRRIGFPGDAFWPGAERLIYYVLFPALLVHKLAIADVGGTPLLPILGALMWMLGAGTLLLFVARHWVARQGPAFTSVYQGSIRFNTYIGLAAVDALYGDPGLVIAAIAMALLIPVINLLCVSAFHLTLHRAGPGPLIRSLLRNPLILGCLIGIALNRTRVGLPGWSASTLGLLGSAALPMGLLAVGVALDLRALGGTGRELLAATIMRFAVMPLLLLVALEALALPRPTAEVLLLFSTLPTATASFILARQLGGDAALMANIVTLQTLVAFLAIPLWVLAAQQLI
ncbi:MAG: AEC family transporter [Gammaproteobacteria bacterium]|nr:MAG: AEC family transporter [Gammaproteobacteria bacterium]